MWTRSELKARAKASIKANYWQCLLVCIVIAVLAGNFISVEYNLDYQEFTLNLGSMTSYYNRPLLFLSLFSASLLGILGIIYSIFIINPLNVGKARYFLENREGVAERETARFAKFMPRMFEYSQISYILAENPGLNSHRVFQMTREMTMGNKWDIFVLYLSFIGWMILSSFTCGIVGVAVMPYMEATYAELYITLRDEYIDAGYAGFDEFPGFYR